MVGPCSRVRAQDGYMKLLWTTEELEILGILRNLSSLDWAGPALIGFRMISSERDLYEVEVHVLSSGSSSMNFCSTTI